MMYIILILAIVAGVVFLLMKSGKIEDKNGNNIPDKLEPVIEEVKEVVKKVKKAAGEVKPAKKSAKKVK
jgi:ABC-type Na+ efflux pump permease subunit